MAEHYPQCPVCEVGVLYESVTEPNSSLICSNLRCQTHKKDSKFTFLSSGAAGAASNATAQPEELVR
jgi:hypothetical protein